MLLSLVLSVRPVGFDCDELLLSHHESLLEVGHLGLCLDQLSRRVPHELSLPLVTLLELLLLIQERALRISSSLEVLEGAL